MEHTVSIDSAVLTLSDIEQMRPTGEIREVEVEVIGLSQRVQISGVESEDIRCVKGAQGSHLDVASGRDLSRSLVTRLRNVMENGGDIESRPSSMGPPPPGKTPGRQRGMNGKYDRKGPLSYNRTKGIIEGIYQRLFLGVDLSFVTYCCTTG
jgi:hypothetical protein